MEGSSSNMRLVSAVLFLAMLLVASEMAPMAAEGRSGAKKDGKVAESKKRTCDSASSKFKGMCFMTSNCATICKKEGFNGGECQGFRRRCVCSKQC